MSHGRNQSESQEQGPTLKKETAQATSEYKKKTSLIENHH
jgi:hypothetical protein